MSFFEPLFYPSILFLLSMSFFPTKKISPLFSIWWVQSVEEPGWQWYKERRWTVKYFNQEPFATENKRPAGLHRQALGNLIYVFEGEARGGWGSCPCLGLNSHLLCFGSLWIPLSRAEPWVAVLYLCPSSPAVLCVSSPTFREGGGCRPALTRLPVSTLGISSNIQLMSVTSSQLLFSFTFPGGAAPAYISVAPFKAFWRGRDCL